MLIRWLTLIVLAFLAVHSLSYGFGSLTDPAGMAQQFGNAEPANEAAENLTGLIGVMLLLMAATAVLAVYLLAKHRWEQGGWLTLGLGIITLSTGIYWATRQRAWDGWFYGAVGVVLLALGVLLGRAESPAETKTG